MLTFDRDRLDTVHLNLLAGRDGIVDAGIYKDTVSFSARVRATTAMLPMASRICPVPNPDPIIMEHQECY